MVYRVILLCASLAAVHAGVPATLEPGPLAYASAPAVAHITYSSPIVSYNIPFATPALTSQSSNIHRSYGNLGQVSTYSKTIDTPFSSVSKADVRISNPGLKVAAAAPLAYVAPTHLEYAASAPRYAVAPTRFTTDALTSQSSNILRSYGNLGQVSSYSKTIDTPFSSVSKADVRVSNPGLKLAAAPASFAYGAPAPLAVADTAHASLLGVAYSAAPAVAHVSYTTNFGSYEW